MTVGPSVKKKHRTMHCLDRTRRPILPPLKEASPNECLPFIHIESEHHWQHVTLLKGMSEARQRAVQRHNDHNVRDSTEWKRIRLYDSSEV